MAANYGMTLACKLDLVTGVHQPRDVYMVALYGSNATLNSFTEVYEKTDEVKGKGYVAGGKPLKGYHAYVEGSRAELGFDTEVRWANATIRSRHALIYNASKGNRAMTILDLGEEASSTNGNWDLLLPPCVIWLG
tara:strand:+ start:79 stop:483 length:405 start_codon:yes stop_codon:yes gene_type:complete